MTLALATKNDIRFRSGPKYSMSDQRAEDAALAERILDRDERALEQAYRSYGGAVASIARKVIKDPDLAEDVVQDVFVTLWRDASRFDSARGSLRTFLITVAHRRAVDLVRSEVARSEREVKTPPPAPTIDLENEIWQRSQSEIVRDAVSQLGEDERKAISLAYFGGLSYVEVAKALAEPEGTVKSRIRSGMKKLSDDLGERLS